MRGVVSRSHQTLFFARDTDLTGIERDCTSKSILPIDIMPARITNNLDDQ